MLRMAKEIWMRVRASVHLARMWDCFCDFGVAANFSEEELKTKLDELECYIRFSIRGQGLGRARFWTCDFTQDYIEINASYRT